MALRFEPSTCCGDADDGAVGGFRIAYYYCVCRHNKTKKCASQYRPINGITLDHRAALFAFRGIPHNPILDDVFVYRNSGYILLYCGLEKETIVEKGKQTRRRQMPP